MQTYTVKIAGVDIRYRIRRSKRAKRYRLQVSPDGAITIVVPHRYPDKQAIEILEEHSDWIIRALRKIENKSRVFPPRLYSDGSLFPYLGELYELTIRPSSDVSGHAALRDGELRIALPQDVKDNEEHIRRLLRLWYYDRAHAEIVPRAYHYAGEMGVAFNRIAIKDQRTVWGSCSRRANLNFNYRLVMAPEPVLEYIIVHELSHLKEPNHSPRFWDTVESTLPNYRVHRKWIKEHGDELIL